MQILTPQTMLGIIALSLMTQPLYAEEEDLNHTVKELRNQIEFLTARLQRLEQKLDKQDSVAESKQPTDKPTTKKVEVGNIKGSIKIPGTDTSLAIGGYVKLDAIYSSQSSGGAGGGNTGDQILLASAIPVNKDDTEEDQITFHARQSRFWLKSYTPTSLGDLNTYVEMDFFAYQAPGDERVSNSYAPRLRHAFGSLGPFLAGQTWTTFMNVQALPELNDFGGPVGRIFARQPQLRWTQPLIEKQLDWMISLESPETTLTNTNGDRETPNDDYFPDIITRINLNRSWGNISLAGMVRNIRSDTGTTKLDENTTRIGAESEAYGGAVSLAGRIKTYNRDDLRFMLNYGNVLGRYASSNLFNDGVINAQGEVKLFNQYGGFVAYRHWWHDNWRSTIAYGFSSADNVDFVADTVSKWAQSAQFNLLWSPIPQTTFGLEYSYASRELQNHDTGDLHRVQFSSIFRF